MPQEVKELWLKNLHAPIKDLVFIIPWLDLHTTAALELCLDIQAAHTHAGRGKESKKITRVGKDS